MSRKSTKDSIEIAVAFDGEAALFTNHDTVNGQVQLKSARNLDDLDVRLTFEGSSFTCIKNTDGLHTHLGRVIGKHLFLKMPIDLAHPVPTLLPGQSSTSSFRFNIPGEISHSCNHTINDVELQAQHTVMPPSVVLNKRVILEDGVTVDAAKIAYGIRLVVRAAGVEIGRTFKLLKFTPASRHPPIPERTLLRRETMLKSGQTASKGAAKLVMETTTIPVFQLPPPQQEKAAILGKLDFLLRYESTENSATPIGISKIDTKLRAITYYNARPFRSPPSIPDAAPKSYRYLEETLETSTFALGEIDWETQNPNDPQVQEQNGLSSTPLSPLTFTSTTISVPLTIPPLSIHTKFLPSFDTCLVSRHHFAELDLTFSQSKQPPASFRIPILITTQNSPSPPPPDIFSMSDHELARLASPPDYSEHLLDDLPVYEPADLRLVQNDGRVETFAYVKSEPWLNVHNAFRHGYKKFKGHWEVRQARAARERG